MYEWEGVAGQPAKKGRRVQLGPPGRVRRAAGDSASPTSGSKAKDGKPFFMDVNFMKMHNPNNPSKFSSASPSSASRYSDAVLELDPTSAGIMDAIRTEAPNTIVVLTSDNGAWQDAYPGRGHDTVPRRQELGLRGRLARARG